jgi:hypothetical protein
MPQVKTAVSGVTPGVTPSRTLTHPHGFAQPCVTFTLTPLTIGGGLTHPLKERGAREAQSVTHELIERKKP